MDVREYNFQFKHYGRRYTANLQIITPFKTKMYRVRVDELDSKHDRIFIFYEVNEKDKRFFYFPMGEQKREIVESILKELRNY